MTEVLVVAPSSRPGLWRVALSSVAVVAAGLLAPGGGLVVALVLAATVLREHKTARKVLIGVGFGLLVLALGAYAAPWGQPSLHIGPAVPAQPSGIVP